MLCENGVRVSARAGLEARLTGRLLIGVPAKDVLVEELLEEVVLNDRRRSRKDESSDDDDDDDDR